MPATVDLVVVLLLASLALAGYAGWNLLQGAREGRAGRFVAADLAGSPGPRLRAPELRLAGRPDELRSIPDGRWIPVEWKSRPAPPAGPAPSHRMQLLAYCQLVEASTGRPPPYGLLRYGDGVEFRVPWDAAARSELLRLRRAVGLPYDGRATPSPGKCGRCRWNAVCDARAVPAR